MQTLSDYLANSPSAVYAIIVAILVVVLIGVVKRWHWAIDPQGNHRSRLLVDFFGYENYRKIMIATLCIGIVAVLILLLMSLGWLGKLMQDISLERCFFLEIKK